MVKSKVERADLLDASKGTGTPTQSTKHGILFYGGFRWEGGRKPRRNPDGPYHRVIRSFSRQYRSDAVARGGPLEGYGSTSGGGSNGRVSPTLPKIESFEPEPLDSDKNDGSQTTSESEAGPTSDSDLSPSCTLSRSLKEDIRSCLGGCRWEKDVNDVVEAAVRGAGGITAARARLQAALLALHDPAPRVPNRGPSLPFCGPGVRPGDVTMMPKNTEMSWLAASALFTLDNARGEALSRRLAQGERFRRRCRIFLIILALFLLIAAIGAVELLMSRGQRMFGAILW